MIKSLAIILFLICSQVKPFGFPDLSGVIGGGDGTPTEEDTDQIISGLSEGVKTEIINRAILKFAESYGFNFNNIESLFTSLKIVNTIPHFERKIEGNICNTTYSNEVNVLVDNLTREIKNPDLAASCENALKTCDCGGKQIPMVSGKCLCPVLLPFMKKRALNREIYGSEKLKILREIRMSQMEESTKVYKKHCSRPGADRIGIRTKNMCHECFYEIYLPPSFFPRVHIHVVCGRPKENTCLTYQGICAKIIRNQDIAQLSVNGKVANNFQLPLTAGCQCEIKNGSPMVNMVFN